MRSRLLSWRVLVPGLVVLLAVLVSWLVFTGRALPRWLPDFIYYPVMGRLYDPCITASSAEEKASAYETLMARLGVDELIRLHSQNFNQPMTAIALGRSGDEEALGFLRRQASAFLGRQVTDLAWGQPSGWAIWGVVASEGVSLEELRRIYDRLPSGRRWPLVFMVIDQRQYRFVSIVQDYQRNHLTTSVDPEGLIGEKVAAFVREATEARRQGARSPNVERSGERGVGATPADSD